VFLDQKETRRRRRHLRLARRDQGYPIRSRRCEQSRRLLPREKDVYSHRGPASGIQDFLSFLAVCDFPLSAAAMRGSALALSSLSQRASTGDPAATSRATIS